MIVTVFGGFHNGTCTLWNHQPLQKTNSSSPCIYVCIYVHNTYVIYFSSHFVVYPLTVSTICAFQITIHFRSSTKHLWQPSMKVVKESFWNKILISREFVRQINLSWCAFYSCTVCCIYYICIWNWKNLILFYFRPVMQTFFHWEPLHWHMHPFYISISYWINFYWKREFLQLYWVLNYIGCSEFLVLCR